MVNAALDRLSGAFDKLYAVGGRDSIAPEKLLRALLLQAFYSVRSERQLMEQITCNMLFRWFIGLSLDAAVWDVTVFTKNRDRLLWGNIARRFFQAVLAAPEVKPLLSSEHVSVDGTLLEAWASMKSFRPKDGSGEPPGPGRNGEAERPGACFAEVARQYEVNRSVLWAWRKQVRSATLAVEQMPVFVPVQIAPEPPAITPASASCPSRPAQRSLTRPQHGLASVTIGLGPNFIAGETVGLAVETGWGEALGASLAHGPTRALTGEPRAAGGVGRPWFVCAWAGGRFSTGVCVGEAIEAGTVMARTPRPRPHECRRRD